jgi:hypothetical protein
MNGPTSTIRGITLIEVLLYSALLSFLLSGFIQYAYGIHFGDLQLMDKINQ